MPKKSGYTIPTNFVIDTFEGGKIILATTFNETVLYD